jgi:hypothetical protein
MRSALFFSIFTILWVCCRAQLSNFAEESQQQQKQQKDDDFVDESAAGAGDPAERHDKVSLESVRNEPELLDLSESEINQMIRSNEIEMTVDDSGRKRLQFKTVAPTVTPVPSSQPSRQPTLQPSSQASCQRLWLASVYLYYTHCLMPAACCPPRLVVSYMLTLLPVHPNLYSLLL